MSNLFDPNPDHNDTWTNPTTGEEFQFDRHRGWIDHKGVRFDGDTMTGTLVLPDTRINGGLLSADELLGAQEQPPFDPNSINWTNWRKATSGDENCNWTDIAYGEGVYVAVSGYPSGTKPGIMRSFDLVNWTALDTTVSPLNMSDTGWPGITYGIGSDGVGRFVAVGSGNAVILYSEDLGLTWHRANNAGYYNMYATTYAEGRFVAVSTLGIIKYSDDGKSWSSATGSGLGNDYDFKDVAYGDGKFIAVSRKGAYKFWCSEDRGETWQKLEAGSSQSLQGIAYGDGQWVAVGTGYTKFQYSDDGINWYYSNTVDQSTYYGVAYGAGSFIAVTNSASSYKPAILRSSDGGRSWVSIDPYPSQRSLLRIRYLDNNYFVTVGRSYYPRVQYLEAPGPVEIDEEPSSSNLYWNEEPVVVRESSRTMTSLLSQTTSSISSRTGKVKYLQDSAPPETQTIELSEDSLQIVDLTYDNGELWYQPSTNTLHVRDSDDWVALFQ